MYHIELLKEYFIFFISRPIHVQLGLIAFFIFSSTIIIAIINILIFNYLTIPKIEKKIGNKLNFYYLWDTLPFGGFLYNHIEIMDYIILKYIAKKFKKNQDNIEVNSNFALKKINYRLENVSKCEVFMSFFTAFNYLLCLIAAIMLSLITSLYHK